MNQLLAMLNARRVGPDGRRRRGVLALAVGALVLVAVACQNPGHPPRTTTTTTSTTTPPTGDCRQNDFTEAVVDARPSTSAGPHYVLTVAGIVGSPRLQARLIPATYVRQPEYWRIEVVACGIAETGAAVHTPFKISLDVTGTLGTDGIEVVGATTTRRIDVPPKPPAPLVNTGWVLDATSLGVPAAGRPITLTFSATDLGGNSACNTYGASFEATGSPTGGSLKVGPMRSTLIGCAPDIANAEATFLRKLGAATSYHVDESMLTLTGPQGRLVFGTPPPTRP